MMIHFFKQFLSAAGAAGQIQIAEQRLHAGGAPVVGLISVLGGFDGIGIAPTLKYKKD